MAKRRSKSKAKTEAGGEFFVATQRDLARCFGKSLRSVEKWASSGAPPVTTQGWSVTAWFRWWAEQQQAPNPSIEAERRLRLARARHSELKIAALENRVIPREENERQRMEIIDAFVSSIERAPSELAPRLAQRSIGEIRETMQQWFDGVRRFLCGDGPHPTDNGTGARANDET